MKSLIQKLVDHRATGILRERETSFALPEFYPSSVRGGKAHEIARRGTGMTFFNRNTGISWAPRDVPHSMESKRIKAADRHIGGLPILLVLFLVLFCHLVFAGNAFQKRWV